MKTKTSVTLSDAALRGIQEYAARFRTRSEFIEAAVSYFLAHLAREGAERGDLDIINRRADALNEEAKDVLDYQVPL